jgi:hypothetical protein
MRLLLGTLLFGTKYNSRDVNHFLIIKIITEYKIKIEEILSSFFKYLIANLEVQLAAPVAFFILLNLGLAYFVKKC